MFFGARINDNNFNVTMVLHLDRLQCVIDAGATDISKHYADELTVGLVL